MDGGKLWAWARTRSRVYGYMMGESERRGKKVESNLPVRVDECSYWNLSVSCHPVDCYVRAHQVVVVEGNRRKCVHRSRLYYVLGLTSRSARLLLQSYTKYLLSYPLLARTMWQRRQLHRRQRRRRRQRQNEVASSTRLKLTHTHQPHFII